MQGQLPDYDRPPVVETILGAVFDPIERFEAPYYGLYWATIRDRFPNAEVRPPMTQGPTLEVSSGAPRIRCWFIDTTSSRLIQLQQDRFYYNWRKSPSVHATQDYPHYADLRPNFQSEWNHFVGFLGTQALSNPRVLSCEITYINHIERGNGWNDYTDLPKIFACLAPGQSAILSAPKSLSFSGTFEIPKNGGEIQLEFQPAIRQDDYQQILQLNVTARGRMRSSSIDDMLGWFDSSQRSMLEAFDEFTRGPLHATFGRKERR